jgi:tRNA(Ile)-lysidine synthetase-like protein
MMRIVDESALQSAIAIVPSGGWGVGVSGGADSVALLRLSSLRPDLSLHVIHLDHQTRGPASTGDAEFVKELATTLRLPVTIALREQVEREITEIDANPSARYRAARFQLFRHVVAREHLDGVILAHHADDQAETVLHRLIRGSGPGGLAGMSVRTDISALTILRPMLAIRGKALRDYLHAIGQSWREDASNASDDYLRNRLRRWLADEPALHAALIDLADACRGLRDWAQHEAPHLAETFSTAQLGGLPDVLAHESARRWLVDRGVPPDQLTEGALDRLLEMCRDAATRPRLDFPGPVRVSRRGGVIWVP